MAVQRFFCNGCGNELKDIPKANEANGNMKRSYMESVSEGAKAAATAQIFGDDFCTTCLPKAPAYWEAKSKAFAESHEILTNRLNKLLHSTFRQPYPQAVGGKKA